MSNNKTANQDYVLGTHDDELQRLGFQNRLWASEATAIWQRAGFAPNQTILDVGCGPGFTTLDILSLVGAKGRVVGVDESERFLNRLNEYCRVNGINNVDTIKADVQQLDLPTNSFDGAYTRWVLCFVKDPESVVQRVARALKPGASFAIQDYLNYRALSVSPKGESMARVVEAVDASWRQRGGDPHICLRLPTMLASAGLEIVDLRPIVRFARPGSALWDWPGSFFRNYIPTLVSLGLLTDSDRKSFEEDWTELSNNKNAVFCTPIVMDLIARKPVK